MAIHITPVGTRGARVPNRGFVAGLFRPMADLMIWMHRRSGGQRLSRMMGFPVVLLTTVGSRTGLRRTAPVGGFPDGEDTWIVVASLAGAARHPVWFINMARRPDDIWLEVGTRRFKVRGQSLEGAERADALRRIAKISPRYGKYQEQTDREIPIVRLTAEH
jgi:deazaflavin-dependent oxidoreductase (nitroreductase family)